MLLEREATKYLSAFDGIEFVGGPFRYDTGWFQAIVYSEL